MKQKIDAGEFKAKCLHLLDEVYRSRKGNVITKRGRAVGRPLPAEDKAGPVIARMTGSAVITGDVVAPIGDIRDADQ